MRVLLDTHAFIWWVTDDPKLSIATRSIIANGENEVYFSVVSGWEMAIKSQIGKLHFSEGLEQLIVAEVQRNNFTILPIRLAHALRTQALPSLHRDPFDRMLIAQSQLEQLPILTVDPLVSQYDIRTIWSDLAS